jgi:hypothetical protein
MRLKTLLLLVLFLVFQKISAQDSTNKTYITSAVGILVPISNFANAYEKSLALTSGFGYKLPRNLLLEFGFEFNAVKYNQVIIDANSSFLFKNTNSSILLAGVSLLQNVPLNTPKTFFLAPYIGTGYINIGEPRLKVDLDKKTIDQSIRRMSGIYVKTGAKIIVKSKYKIAKTLFLDPSIWTSNINVQQSTARAFSIRVGTIIGF